MRTQKGFTLIEIAIVLVIIGLLLGGVLKGQELITSARVRNLISMQDGFKAAFYGFQDRFRAYPGDYTLATTNIKGATVNGNGNGRIESAAVCGAIVGCVAYENIGVWDQLSHAGFINGTYTAAATVGDTTNPKNPYGIYMDLQYDNVYADSVSATPASKHNLKTGGQIPVEILAEVDRKVDDGNPYTGSFRFSVYAGNGTAPVAGATTDCASPAPPSATGIWNATSGNTNCGGATLF